MKRWMTLLALLLALVWCFPAAQAEQVAAGEADGEQAAAYVPGKVASELLLDALTAEGGGMLVAQIRGEGIPDEAGLPDMTLRLGVGATTEGVRVELGLRESQQNVGFDAILDANAQGIAIQSDLLPGERYTVDWQTLLGMELTDLGDLGGAMEAQMAQATAALNAIAPMLEPYIEIVNGFLPELATQEYHDVPEENGVAPMAYEQYIVCTHVQAADLLTQLADQLAGDAQLTPVLDAMLAAEGYDTADLVEMMRDAAEPLAESEGYFVLGMGTNYDWATKPWFITVNNTHEDGAYDSLYLGLEPDEDNSPIINVGYLQVLADESFGAGVDVMAGYFPDAQDASASDWAARVTVTEDDATVGTVEFFSNNEAIATADGMSGYENTVYIGVGDPEITMEYAHEMNRYPTADGGEALKLEAAFIPDKTQDGEAYAVTLETSIAPGADGVRGEGKLMFETTELPAMGVRFDLQAAAPMQLGDTSTVVALETLSGEQLEALGERIEEAFTQCLEAMMTVQ